MGRLFDAICKGWNAMHAALGGQLAVGACGAGQQFLAIDGDTGLATFVTLPDREIGNVLIRVRLCTCLLEWHIANVVKSLLR